MRLTVVVTLVVTLTSVHGKSCYSFGALIKGISFFNQQ